MIIHRGDNGVAVTKDECPNSQAMPANYVGVKRRDNCNYLMSQQKQGWGPGSVGESVLWVLFSNTNSKATELNAVKVS